jgi:hypothetical protein
VLFPPTCVDTSVCAKADSNVIDDKRNDAVVISNVKKAINGKFKSDKIPFMQPLCENML